MNKITFKNVVARGDRRSFLYPLGEKPISLLFLHNPALCILLVDLYIVALVFIFVSNTYELWAGGVGGGGVIHRVCKLVLVHVLCDT